MTLLFALTIEPLVIAIRASPEVRGFRRKVEEDKVELYADNKLLFLGDTQTSLLNVMKIIKNFRQFFGLTMNWEKYTLQPLDPFESPLLDEVTQTNIMDKMKYLGGNISV